MEKCNTVFIPPRIFKIYQTIITISFICISLSAQSKLKSLPSGFAKKVEAGWLPPIVCKGKSMPIPIIKKWAKRRGSGQVRVLFITGRKIGMYECLSLAKAFDFECDVIPFWSDWRRAHKDKPLWNLLRYYLRTRQYDVIAVSGIWLSYLPDDCEQEIASIIKHKGVGFVYAMHGIFPRVPALGGKPSPILTPILPLKMDVSAYKSLSKKVVPVRGHFLSSGQDFTQFKWLCNVNTTLRKGATPLLKSEDNQRILAAINKYGKGRIMAYNHAYNEGSRHMPFFLPRALKDVHKASGNLMDIAQKDGVGKFCRWINGIEYVDQFYGWLGKSILWAAQKEPKLSLKSVEIAPSNFNIKLGILNPIKRNYRIRVVSRSTFNSQQKTVEYSSSLNERNEVLNMRLPSTGMTGKHFLDVYLLNKDGAVLDWNSSTYKVQDKLKVTYKPDYTVYNPSDSINLIFKTSGLNGHKAITISAKLFDLEGRLLINHMRKMKTNGKSQLDVPINMNLAGIGIKSRLANAQFIFSTAQGKSIELRDQFFIRQMPDWRKYHIGGYHGFYNANPMCDVLINVLKQTGHDTIKLGYPTPVKSRLGTETGMNNWANWVIRRGNTPKKMKRLIGWLKSFSPIKYELQDEPELQVYPASINRFASKVNKKHFQVWLKKKYSTLENLNQAWGRKYKTWDQVVRPLWHEIIDSCNWTAWFDSRHALDEFFLSKYVVASDAIKEVVPNSVCSLNPRSLGTFSGINLGNLSRKVGSANLYNDYVRRKSAMGYLQLGGRWFNPVASYIGYTWATNPGINRITREAWDSARRGANICWFAPIYQELPPKTDFSYINGDFTLNAKGKAVEAVNKVLLSGPGDLAVNTKQFNDGIFVYYPRSLFFRNDLAFFKQRLLNNPGLNRKKMRGMQVWANQLPNSFLPHLDALGYQYEYGDEQDLTAERLKKTRLVILQSVICLSLKKMSLLRDFVKNGGCVIAEAGTARRDENGKIFTKTPQVFKDIFGIERIEPNLSPLISPDKIRIVSNEVNVKKFSSGGLGRIYKKGKAFFFNFHLPKSNSGVYTVRKVLTAAKIEPSYQLKDNWLGAQTKFNLICSMIVRKRGDLTYLYLTGDGNKTDDDFSIKLPKKMFVYDVLTDKTFGQLENIEGKIHYGEARLFALSQSPVRSFQIVSNKSNLYLGEWASLDLKLETMNGTPGDRLVMLKCTSQTKINGLLPDISRKVMLKNGKATVKFFVPHNVSLRLLRLTARDLTTGAKTNISFRIKKQ